MRRTVLAIAPEAEPVTATRRRLAALTIAAIALAGWVAIAPSPALDGRTLCALAIGAAAILTAAADGAAPREVGP